MSSGASDSQMVGDAAADTFPQENPAPTEEKPQESQAQGGNSPTIPSEQPSTTIDTTLSSGGEALVSQVEQPATAPDPAPVATQIPEAQGQDQTGLPSISNGTTSHNATATLPSIDATLPSVGEEQIPPYRSPSAELAALKQELNQVHQTEHSATTNTHAPQHPYQQQHADVPAQTSHAPVPASQPAHSQPPVPPMQHYPPQQPAPQYAPAPQQLPPHSGPPPHPAAGYYTQHMGHPHQQYAAHLQYAMPAMEQNKMLSGGRHKKEVKRRTKTGCLTCRKRRIKCDEGHPTCRNCTKSKRECLGYDPVFRQQPPPSTIHSTQSPDPSNPAPAPAHAYSHLLQAYAPVTSQSPSDPHAAYHTPQPHHSTEYGGTSIDSGLEGTDVKLLQTLNTFNNESGQPQMASSDPEPQPGQQDIERAPAYGPPPPATVRERPINVEQLLGVGGPPPPPPPTGPTPPARVLDLKTIYNDCYAPALDRFLEVKWFTTKSLPVLLKTPPLCNRFLILLDIYVRPDIDENDDLAAKTHGVEAACVWGAMALPRAALAEVPPAQANSKDTLALKEVVGRVDAIESILTGNPLPSIPLPESAAAAAQLAAAAAEAKPNNTGVPSPKLKVLDQQLRDRELDFWGSVGSFAAHQSIRPAEAHAALNITRFLLDTFENRDVIYSIAACRHWGHTIKGFPDNMESPTSNEDLLPETKVWVAKNFLDSQSWGQATNQVTMRVSGMAVQSWHIRD